MIVRSPRHSSSLFFDRQCNIEDDTDARRSKNPDARANKTCGGRDFAKIPNVLLSHEVLQCSALPCNAPLKDLRKVSYPHHHHPTMPPARARKRKAADCSSSPSKKPSKRSPNAPLTSPRKSPTWSLLPLIPRHSTPFEPIAGTVYPTLGKQGRRLEEEGTLPGERLKLVTTWRLRRL